MKLLEESGYDGPRHFDAHALRTESPGGVWDFASGCMRTYLILRDKAKQFAADREIQALLKEIRGQAPVSDVVVIGNYSRKQADALKMHAFDREALAARPLPYERLDQLVVDLLLGAPRRAHGRRRCASDLCTAHDSRGARGLTPPVR